MRLAGLDECEDGHEQREHGKCRILQDFFGPDRLGNCEATAIDVHVQEIRARNDHEKSQHDQCEQGSPDAQTPTNHQQQPKKDLGEGQSMGDELYSPRRQHLKRVYLVREVRDVGRNGKLQDEHRPQVRVGEKNLGDARVYEDSTEDQAADPDDEATKVEWTGLHHL